MIGLQIVVGSQDPPTLERCRRRAHGGDRRTDQRSHPQSIALRNFSVSSVGSLFRP